MNKQTLFHIKTAFDVVCIAVGFTSPLIIIVAMMGHH